MFYLLLLVNGAVCLYIFISEWRRVSYLTLVSFFVFLKIFVPLVLVSNFALDGYDNTLGHYQYHIDEYFLLAYEISTIGFMFFVLGLYFGRSRSSRLINNTLDRFVRKPVELTPPKFFIFVCFVFSAVVVFYAISKGAPLFNLRSFAQSNPDIRPVIKIAFLLAPYGLIISLIICLKANQLKGKFIYGVTFLMFAFILFCSGSRSNLMEPLVIFFAFYCSVKKDKNPVYIMAMIPVFILFLIFMKETRISAVGDYSVELSLFDELSKGATFNDLRVFSALLGGWDGEYFGLKSYAAGIFSFVPSSLWEFKDQWLFGNIGPTMLGLNPEIHPGTRPVVFTEPYFSFGILGVIASAGLFGYFLQRISIEMSRSFFDWVPIVVFLILYQFYSFLYHPVFMSQAFMSLGVFVLFATITISRKLIP
jgi:oligosaccharide repeat unit polymerase